MMTTMMILMNIVLLFFLSAGHFWQITKALGNFSFQQTATGPSSVCLGNDAIFTCKAQFTGDNGDRIVNARWMRDEDMIIGTNCDTRNCTPGHTILTERNSANQLVVTGLVVNDTTVDDDGIVYTCSPDDDATDIISNATLNITTEIPAVDDLNVVDECENVVVTWKRIMGPCENSSYNIALLSSNITLLSSNGSVDYVTNIVSYTFSNTTELTGAISVSVTAVNKVYNGNASVATPNDDNLKIDNINDGTLCATYFNISWDAPNMPCGGVSYSVTISQLPSSNEKQEVVNANIHTFSGLKSASTYRVTVAAIDRRVTGPKTIHTVQLPLSEFPPVVQNVMSTSIRNQDKITDYTISWKKPTVRDPCTTAPITSYDVQLDFDHDRSSFSICISNISSEITCILMSKYFPNHPITNVKYEVIVFAVNERGRGPISDMQGGPTSGDSNTGAIVGGVIGVIVAMIVVVTIIIVIYRRRKGSTDGDRQELKSPVDTGGSHTGSVKPSTSVPHQTDPSGEEYALTNKVTSTKPQQQPTEEYAMVDKSKRHAHDQGIRYADLQDLPGSGSNPDPTSTYTMVA